MKLRVVSSALTLYKYFPLFQYLFGITVTFNSDPNGIEGVEVENDETVEYYNLQGVKVNNPANGILIQVQGNKASKVYVK